jgi:phosphatidylethanolamine-binding protein (PEBP) family uncharacterized protein
MKTRTGLFLICLLSLNSISTVLAEETLTISLADSAWNGKKIPASQVCKKFGSTDAASPALTVNGIPAGTEALIVAFHDESYTPMDNGGHGVLRYAHQQGTTAQLSSVSGESDTLPAGVDVFTKHRGTGWSGTAGAYLPPCSGGRGNTYTASVSAVKMRADGTGIAETLAIGKVVLGRY